MGATDPLVTLDEIRSAATAIRRVVRRTPLWPVDEAGAGDERSPLRLKCENLQRGGSFKLRGAYNFIARLPADGRTRGVITYSSGNHGRAVALAASERGLHAVVVVPVDAPEVKVQGIRAAGAEVILEGTTSIERQRRALEIAEDRRLEVVPPFDHRDIIAGQATVGMEIIEDWPEVERVVVPVGGGGLISGVVAAIRALAPRVGVYGVEPKGAASMSRSLEMGGPASLEEVDTIADGLKPVRPGDLTFAHVRALATDVVTVADEEIVDAMIWCARECKLVVEPSGAAALAAVRSGAIDEDVPTAVVLSGGNLRLSMLAERLGPNGVDTAGDR